MTRRLLLALSALSHLAGCGQAGKDGFQGYVEGEYLYLAAPQAGYLQTLDAPRGSRVAQGQPVFALAPGLDEQALAEAEARAASAKDKLENLKAAKRPAEIAALEARLREAEASVRLAKIHLQRQQALLRKDLVAPTKVDEAQAAYDQAAASAEETKKQLETYRIPVGRQAEIRVAWDDFAAAEALAAQKRWAVEHKTVIAPVDGEISESYYRPGEWVAAGAAVASLLPDARRRLRFFVPETVLSTLGLGDAVEAVCDGCAAPIRAKIDFIAPVAEYTPPVIYSRGSREKLLFRVEAAPEQAAGLRPGLPVDVRLVR